MPPPHTHTHTHTGTFIRVHHAFQHGDRVVGLQLQGHVPHRFHQLREEVGHLAAVLQQNVAILAVGEIRVAQVGAGEGEFQSGSGSALGLGPGVG